MDNIIKNNYDIINNFTNKQKQKIIIYNNIKLIQKENIGCITIKNKILNLLENMLKNQDDKSSINILEKTNKILNKYNNYEKLNYSDNIKQSLLKNIEKYLDYVDYIGYSEKESNYFNDDLYDASLKYQNNEEIENKEHKNIILYSYYILDNNI
jgi:hypothetical protein